MDGFTESRRVQYRGPTSMSEDETASAEGKKAEVWDG